MNRGGSRAEYILAVAVMNFLFHFVYYPNVFNALTIKGLQSLGPAAVATVQQLTKQVKEVVAALEAEQKREGVDNKVIEHIRMRQLKMLPNIGITADHILRISPLLQPHLSILKKVFTPVMIHTNFCDDKRDCLTTIGAWFLQQHMNNQSYYCLNDPLVHTPFAEVANRHGSLVYENIFFKNLDWIGEFTKAHAQLLEIRSLPNNTVLKIGHRSFLWLIADNSMRLFYNGEVYLKRGYKWSDVKQIHTQYSYFMNYTMGETIMD